MTNFIIWISETFLSLPGDISLKAVFPAGRFRRMEESQGEYNFPAGHPFYFQGAAFRSKDVRLAAPGRRK